MSNIYEYINPIPSERTTPEISEEIASIIARESKMLHPTPSSIENSLNQGLAIYGIDENTGDVVSFCRFIPLLTDNISSQLGLNNFPEIWELGSVIVKDGYRGQHRGSHVITNLHMMHLEKIRNQKVLILGTTTTRNMLGGVMHARSVLGIEYARTMHTNDHLEFIGATTCVCNPGDVIGDNLELSSIGTHMGLNACQIRTDDTAIHLLSSYENIQNICEGNCGMFVSDLPLAYAINEKLKMACDLNGLTLEDYSRLIQG